MRVKKYTKVILSAIIALIFILGGFTAINRGTGADSIPEKEKEILELESRKSFDFFWNEANSDKSSQGYGLIRDRAPGDSNIASVASVGYGLSAIAIGAERKWVSHEEAKERALGTLNTLLNSVEGKNGFFYHFVNMNTGKREWSCEISIIDTAIAVSGAIHAGEYFGGEVKKKAEEVYKRVDWNWYRNPKTNQFYMGYTPEKGFFGAWDMAAEQFMMYFLGAGSPTHPISGDMFYSFNRKAKSYGFYPAFIQSPTGSLFTYQFSYAWFDLRNKVDNKGVNWWEYSIIASKASRQYSIDNSRYFKTFGENSWGVTASDGPNGYSGAYGMNSAQNDGTIPPCGAAGSIVFTPKESIDALNYYYKEHKELWGKYGFKDAYNIDVSPAWYDKDVIGIDKGITLLMIENYRTGSVWKYFMKNKYVQEGMKKAGVVDIESKGKPVAHSVIIDGVPPVIGQVLTARYNYFSSRGIKEGKSNYRWLIASSKDGEYKEIPGENSLTYKIKKEDAGKYIKFEVTPKEKLSLFNLFSMKGQTAASFPMGEVSEKDPRMFNKSENLNEAADNGDKFEGNETTLIDDFDANKAVIDWKDAGDGVYKLSIEKGKDENKINVLAVNYDKGGKEWAYFYTSFEIPKDISAFEGIQTRVYGNVSFILKFEDESGQGIAEKKFVINDENKWQEVKWNFMGIQENLKRIKRILIFASPGEKSKSGSFQLDEIKLVQ